MKKYFLLIIILCIFLIPLWMWLWWYYTPKRELNILIVDKTVVRQPAQEHESINWVLKNNQYIKSNGEYYDISTDYMGFYPFQNKKFYINSLEKRDTAQIKKIAKTLDAAYFADCYGIYYNDWYDGDVRNHSKIIYGGMRQQDIDLMRAITKENKLLISEFNCMASPTPKSIRAQFEDLYAIRWTGWIGRYVDELDSSRNSELPRWAVINYDKDHKIKWNFSGQGIILVNEYGRVEVLEDRRHLNGVTPLIITNEEEQNSLELPEKIRYPFWFEINLSSRKNNVLSVYKLNTNLVGDSILIANNILKVFPAVIERKINNSMMYYFAGDFADNPIDYDLAKFKKVEWLKYISINKENYGERESFFYEFYLPLLTNILKEYELKISKAKREEIPIYFGMKR